MVIIFNKKYKRSRSLEQTSYGNSVCTDFNNVYRNVHYLALPVCHTHIAGEYSAHFALLELVSPIQTRDIANVTCDIQTRVTLTSKNGKKYRAQDSRSLQSK